MCYIYKIVSMDTISTYNHADAHSGHFRVPTLPRLRSIKALFIKAYRHLRRLVAMPAHTTMRIEHLHKGCREIDNPSRQIFILYVKGYSMNEISKLSGTHHSSISSIVRHTLRSIHQSLN